MPDCKECKAERRSVPYIAHESAMARAERTAKRLWILIIILVLLLAGSNVAWIVYESQFEDVVTSESYEATTDGGGTAIANGGGEVTYYGESEVHQDNENAQS